MDFKDRVADVYNEAFEKRHLLTAAAFGAVGLYFLGDAVYDYIKSFGYCELGKDFARLDATLETYLGLASLVPSLWSFGKHLERKERRHFEVR